MLQGKIICHGKTKKVEEDPIYELKSASKYKEVAQVEELYDTINNDIEESFEYARYWHGYLIILRPLLLFMNINTIRIFLTIILIILSILLLYLIAKKINIVTMIIFLISLIGIDYFYMGISLQGVSVIIIMTILSIIILAKEAKIKNIELLFFITGMLTNFFDFLTVPVLTLGMPLTLLFLLKQKEESLTIKQTTIVFMKNSISWAIGYASTWISKWIIIDALYGKNVINSAFQQVLYRWGAHTKEIKYIATLKYNILYTNIHAYIALMLAICIYTVTKYKTINMNKNKANIKKILEKIFPYILIFLISMIWYRALNAHSYQHCFFTYKNMLLVMLGVSISLVKIIDDSDKKDLERQKEN